ncbi:MAG: 5-oxoprolinase (ATP-hydrolyzing) [Ilumatobacteraceae bacterium]|nr:5-oxoprolinase (ATP-hydrolyzing) [Ilumatobacteraceae bacterium]
MTAARSTQADDAVTAEVVRNALSMAAQEGGVVVVRAAHSTFIQEGADASAAVLDAVGRLVAQSTATTLMHAASLRESLRALLAEIPVTRMQPGDVFAQNDPFKGGIHANDIAVLRPVFGAGASGPHYFAGTIIHVADLGGGYAGGVAATAQDMFAEGLILPPVHLYRGGEPEAVVWTIIEHNSRTPDKVVGDIRALVAGATIIARRVEELLERYGVDALQHHVDDYIAYTETRMRAELGQIPVGTYTGSFTIDSDGIEADKTYEVTLAVQLPGDGTISLDFTGTSAQARGSINASYSQALSGVLFAVRCFLDPSIPMNEGCYNALDFTFPRGSLVNPNPPAACGGRIVVVTAIMEAIVEALSTARPDRAVASSGIVHLYGMSGGGGSSNGTAPWMLMAMDFGGLGARAACDGPDATGAFVLGGRGGVLQVEPYEAQYPVMVEHTRPRCDSGGPGEWRGGLGIDTAIRLLADAELVVRGDRMILAPPGRDGGAAGEVGYWRVEHPDGSVDELAHRQSHVRLAAGDVFRIGTSGGGGLGDPLARDPQFVVADVRDRRVSRDAARDRYGVIVDDRGELDEVATTRRRGVR